MEHIMLADSDDVYLALSKKANNLIRLAESVVHNADFTKDIAWKREEFAAHSSLHRGYYHPSPIYDFIVGNTKRGKLLSRITKCTNFTHRYLYDENDNLRVIETYNNKVLSSIERIFLQNEDIIGVTLDKNGHLRTVVCEAYADLRIKELILVNCLETGKGTVCCDIHYERYYYDDMGLLECDFITAMPSCKHVAQERYRFTREDGFLVAYTNITPNRPFSSSKQITYRPGIKRKA